MTQSVILVGASHAAAQACVNLRQGGWEGAIAVIGDEAELPYHRPPLSKDYLSGEKSIDDILIRPLQAYEKAEIDMRLGTRVKSIDPSEKSVLTEAGERLVYSKLILATGARVRKLPGVNTALKNIYYLRNAADVMAIKEKSKTAKSAVIIGGGYIGLETAASLRMLGLEVTILEAMPRILQRVTAPELSDFYKRVHTEEGIEIFEDVQLRGIQEHGEGLYVETQSQGGLIADMVIVGIGVIPNIELALAAGLKVGNGIEVNEFCQTSDPDIYAIGDVAWHFNKIYRTHIRLESVPNATEQGKTAALHINGQAKPYNSLPWFWSDQLDMKLQIAGLSTGYDNIVIRGDIEQGREFSVFYFNQDKFLAVDAVNAPRDFMFGRRTLTKGQTLSKDGLENTDVPLADLVLEA